MEPNTIHRKTTGPKQAPIRAPKIGPVPAMFSSCTRKAFQGFMGTQSTPSLMAMAGVCRPSGPNVFSTTLPYTAKPARSTTREIISEIMNYLPFIGSRSRLPRVAQPDYSALL